MKGNDSRINSPVTSTSSVALLSPREQKVDKIQRYVRKRFFRVSISSVSAVLAIAILAYVILRKTPPDIPWPPAQFLAAQPFQCDQASDEVRDAIDYYQDPCEDFHAFACNKSEGKTGHRDIATRKVEDVLATISSSAMRPQDASAKVASFYKSCIYTMSSLPDLRENVGGFFEITNKTLLDVKNLATNQDILFFMVHISFEFGLNSLISFHAEENDTLAVTVKEPLFSFLGEADIKWLLGKLGELLGVAHDSRGAFIQTLISIDRELSIAWAGSSQLEELRLGALEDLTDKMISLEDWIHLLNNQTLERTQSWTPRSTLKIQGTVRTKIAFSIILKTRDHIKAIGYLILHYLLPSDLLKIVSAKRGDQSCLTLTSQRFNTVWHDITAQFLYADDRDGEVRFMVAALMLALKQLIRRRNLFSTPEDVQVAAAKLDSLQISYPKPTDSPVISRRIKGLVDMNSSSLYRNLLRLELFHLSHNITTKSADSDESDIVSYHPHYIRITTNSLRPPFYCHGADKFLNYATLGVAIAEGLLKSLGGPFAENRKNATLDYSSVTTSNLKQVTTCLSKSAKKVSGGVTLSKSSMRKIMHSTSALQLAMEASQLEGSAASEVYRIVEPAMEQTFFARYCRHLRAINRDPFEEDGVPVRLRCNIAVMNSPLFTNLFQCEPDQAMMPPQHCPAI